MANKMLIDATHPEETRVVVLRGNRVEEFDFESAHRKQLRGNIYLAKVTRVEPSLQAAFVDYGGNRHGFLAFSEIHPDYYQIPVADRQALIEEEERAQRDADDEADRRSHRHRGRNRPMAARHNHEVMHGEQPDEPAGDAPAVAEFSETSEHSGAAAEDAHADESAALAEREATPADDEPATDHEASSAARHPGDFEAMPAAEDTSTDADQPEAVEAASDDDIPPHAETDDGGEADGAEDGGEEDEAAEEIVESVGGADALEEVPDRAPRYRRQYKIQEVIKRRQVMLVQVVKEERGTKGAALTTYLSLAGRYSVLMPNTARGGGISRKITSSEDRSRLKEVAQELEVPEGMGVILRTAGASRTKTEIKRDFEYLLRLWETVRDLTLNSTAPKLVYEEGSLVKRSIRDLYSKDIDEVAVAGPEAYQEAKDFMRMLMPSHAKNVRLYAETQPLLSRHGVENQLDAMFSPVVQLRSGGYIVINQAEALVAIDVNSGRATREHHIEDTALKTNLEAADEIARQLRLRDLAGLIVIDFIDMDEKRNNRSVERRLKECLKQDRARIQVGRISHFGLLEMSRQRIRTSVLESSTEKCPYCGGSGHVRSVSSLALQVLRALEEQLMKGGTHNLIARTRPDVALYVLNQKRAHLRSLEERFAITITVMADESVTAPQAFLIERGEQVHTIEAARTLAAQQPQALAAPLEEDDDLEEVAAEDGEEAEAAEAAAQPDEAGGRRRRRRRRRGRDNGDGGEPGAALEAAAETEVDAEAEASTDDESGEDHVEAAADGEAGNGRERSDPRHDGERRRRRRGRRGGRRNRQERDGEGSHENGANAPQHEFDAEGARPEGAMPGATGPEARSPATESGSHGAESDFHLADADAGLDTAPPAPPSHSMPDESASAEPAPAEAPASGRQRRRSTVREPAPLAGGTETAGPAPAASAAAEPVIVDQDKAEAADRPRRTGWWSRRSAGG